MGPDAVAGVEGCSAQVLAVVEGIILDNCQERHGDANDGTAVEGVGSDLGDLVGIEIGNRRALHEGGVTDLNDAIGESDSEFQSGTSTEHVVTDRGDARTDCPVDCLLRFVPGCELIIRAGFGVVRVVESFTLSFECQG